LMTSQRTSMPSSRVSGTRRGDQPRADGSRVHVLIERPWAVAQHAAVDGGLSRVRCVGVGPVIVAHQSQEDLAPGPRACRWPGSSADGARRRKIDARSVAGRVLSPAPTRSRASNR
jgi:hypothetical protein